MSNGTSVGTVYVRRVFFILLVLVLITTLGGIIAFEVMENQARAALPPHEQTAESIAINYDGAVCLGCDLGRIFLVMFGSLGLVAVLIGWGIYEIGRRALIYWATPK